MCLLPPSLTPDASFLNFFGRAAIVGLKCRILSVFPRAGSAILGGAGWGRATVLVG